MDDRAIIVEGVSKTFLLPHEKSTSIKNLVISFWKRKRGFEKLQVLEDISFEVKQGEFLGVVGRNGSGKSTLLKLLAGIYSPTKGTIQINGKLTPFIELGVGFNPELSGRENVFLNGALLGFNRSEMSSMYKDIVSFAELEKFMDQKLKNYSSGMQVRLAFSIAIRARSPILLLDEVLAVGDEAFQRKCFSYFEELKRTKKTVILVTHSMPSVERYCTRAIFIDNGKIVLDGDPNKVAAAYSRSNDERYESTMKVAKTDESIKKEKTNLTITTLNNNLRKVHKYNSGDKMVVKLSWTEPKVQYVSLSIIRQSGENIFTINTIQEKINVKGKQEILCDIDLPLADGSYFIKAGLFGTNDDDRIDFEEKGPTFEIHRNYSDIRWDGLVRLTHSWRK